MSLPEKQHIIIFKTRATKVLQPSARSSCSPLSNQPPLGNLQGDGVRSHRTRHIEKADTGPDRDIFPPPLLYVCLPCHARVATTIPGY